MTTLVDVVKGFQAAKQLVQRQASVPEQVLVITLRNIHIPYELQVDPDELFGLAYETLQGHEIPSLQMQLTTYRAALKNHPNYNLFVEADPTFLADVMKGVLTSQNIAARVSKLLSRLEKADVVGL